MPYKVSNNEGYEDNVIYLVIPLFVATINTGAMSDSRARLRNEKHSISNMCTSSINRTFKGKEYVNRHATE